MLSNTSTYAIRAVIYLALFSSDEKKIGIREISGELGIPSPFLGKILQMLAKRKILNSTKGPKGGFNLKKSAIDIPLIEIVEIIDGTDSFNNCVIKTSTCSHDTPCSIHRKIAPFRKEIKSVFMTETIADLAAEFRNGKERIRL